MMPDVWSFQSRDAGGFTGQGSIDQKPLLDQFLEVRTLRKAMRFEGLSGFSFIAKKQLRAFFNPGGWTKHMLRFIKKGIHRLHWLKAAVAIRVDEVSVFKIHI